MLKIYVLCVYSSIKTNCKHFMCFELDIRRSKQLISRIAVLEWCQFSYVTVGVTLLALVEEVSFGFFFSFLIKLN